MFYDMRITATNMSTVQLARVVPILADFADAYALLPAFADKIVSMIFGHSWDGYEVVANNPFPMLLTACKLKSATIYEEAMKHAMVIDRTFSSTSKHPEYNTEYFADHHALELQEKFESHVRQYNKDVRDSTDELLNINAGCYCNTIGLAREIGVAIYRDWVINHIMNDYTSKGLSDLLRVKYDIGDIIHHFGEKDWTEKLKVRFGYIHRAVEGCFKEATDCAGYRLAAPTDISKPYLRTLPRATWLAFISNGRSTMAVRTRNTSIHGRRRLTARSMLWRS